MNKKRISLSFFSIGFILFIFFQSCNNSKRSPERDIARSPQELTEKAINHIEKLLNKADNNDGKIDDSLVLHQSKPVQLIYKQTKNNTTDRKSTRLNSSH